MAKVAIKYENIVPHGEIFCTSILKVQQHWGRCWRNRKKQGTFLKKSPTFFQKRGRFSKKRGRKFRKTPTFSQKPP